MQLHCELKKTHPSNFVAQRHESCFEYQYFYGWLEFNGAFNTM